VSDPQFPLNCPRCGKRLTYVRSEGGPTMYEAAHFYLCSTPGTVIAKWHFSYANSASIELDGLGGATRSAHRREVR
jgi:hypothetical protein